MDKDIILGAYWVIVGIIIFSVLANIDKAEVILKALAK